MDGAYLRQTWSLTKRELRHWYRSKSQILMTFIMPLIWLTLFGFAMSGFISSMGDVDYFSFLAMGIVVMSALSTAMNSGMSLVWDRRFGFLDKLKVTPIPRGVIPLARVLSTAIKTLIQSLIMLGIALLLGLNLSSDFSVLSFLIIILVVVCTSMTFSSMFVSIGLVVKNQDALMSINVLLNLPLMMASGLMFPTSSFPRWLQIIADLNPLTYAADAIRRVSIDVPSALVSVPGLSVGQDVIVIVCVAAAFTIIGMLFAKRGLRT
ncbi:MAG: ABC transporter permease [Candidatus Methanomethylophilaceae archaeon]